MENDKYLVFSMAPSGAPGQVDVAEEVRQSITSSGPETPAAPGGRPSPRDLMSLKAFKAFELRGGGYGHGWYLAPVGDAFSGEGRLVVLLADGRVVYLVPAECAVVEPMGGDSGPVEDGAAAEPGDA